MPCTDLQYAHLASGERPSRSSKAVIHAWISFFFALRKALTVARSSLSMMACCQLVRESYTQMVWPPSANGGWNRVGEPRNTSTQSSRRYRDTYSCRVPDVGQHSCCAATALHGLVYSRGVTRILACLLLFSAKKCIYACVSCNRASVSQGRLGGIVSRLPPVSKCRPTNTAQYQVPVTRYQV